MPAREAFLEAITANPDDDGLRLVYADWLDDQGDVARAEFIRVQIELATMAVQFIDRFGDLLTALLPRVLRRTPG